MLNSTMWPLLEEAKSKYVICGKTVEQHQASIIGENFKRVENAWISVDDTASILAAKDAVLTDGEGRSLASVGNGSKTIIASSSFIIEYPWNLINIAEQVIASLTDSSIKGNVHPNAVLDGYVHLGEGSRILPGVYIEGNVVIGEDCKIGPNCYIRGNTSIGDKCHIGQSVEIKNSVIGSNTNIGHLSYVGDSIIGNHANFGAGTITSNFRHDGGNHRSVVQGKLLDTGRRKFGSIIADKVHTGINTSIYPGRKIGVNCSTRPCEVVQRDITQ